MNTLKSISYVKLGLNKVQIRYDEKIHYFEGDSQDVDHVIEMVNDAKSSPHKIPMVQDFISGKPRSYVNSFKIDRDGRLFFRDFAEPVASSLVERIKQLKEVNDIAGLAALENFQSRLVLNRNSQARKDLYHFLSTNFLSITPKGYFVAYKAVARRKKHLDPDVVGFLKSQSFTIGTDYLVRIYSSDDVILKPFSFTEIQFQGNKKTIGSLEHESSVEDYRVIGRLDGLYNSLEANDTGCFVDKHTKSIEQNLGDLITMPRAECDDDPAVACSYGLHVGNPEYVNSFASSGDAILIALVSPTDVIAVPSHDVRKMRVCQYFIAGFSELDESGKIKPVEDLLYENDFQDKEMAQVQQELKDGNFERYVLPDEVDINQEEIQRIIQKRLKSANEVTV